jgi:hypothetical protein
MSAMHAKINQILDMQRRGSKDYDQTAELLEAYYRTLDPKDQADLFADLESRLIFEELQPPSPDHASTILGGIIKEWLRFGAADNIAPRLFLLINSRNPSNMKTWVACVYPPLRQGLLQYASRLSQAGLDEIERQCGIFTAAQPQTGLRVPQSMTDAARDLETIVQKIRDERFEKTVHFGRQEHDKIRPTLKPPIESKEDYFRISAVAGLPKRCPILERCERRAHTIALFNEMDPNNAAKSVGLRSPIIESVGEPAKKVGGTNNAGWSGLCPEVSLFESGYALTIFAGKPVTSGEWDTYMNPTSRILETGHYTECAEYSAFLNRHTVGSPAAIDYVQQLLTGFKSHRLIAALIVIAAVIIGIGKFTDALRNISNFFQGLFK